MRIFFGFTLLLFLAAATLNTIAGVLNMIDKEWLNLSGSVILVIIMVHYALKAIDEIRLRTSR